MTRWRRRLPLKRSRPRQVPSDHRKWIELGREEEVRRMARSRIFDRGRGSWRVREADYVVRQDQSALKGIVSIGCVTHGHIYIKTWLRM